MTRQSDIWIWILVRSFLNKVLDFHLSVSLVVIELVQTSFRSNVESRGYRQSWFSSVELSIDYGQDRGNGGSILFCLDEKPFDGRYLFLRSVMDSTFELLLNLKHSKSSFHKLKH